MEMTHQQIFRKVLWDVLSIVFIYLLLIVLKYVGFGGTLFLGSSFAGIIVGALFAVVALSWVVFRSGSWNTIQYAFADRLPIFFFYIILGAVLFFGIASFTDGNVFGINFTTTGPSPINAFRSQLAPIACVGGLIGVYLVLGTLIDIGFSQSNSVGYFLLVWVLMIGGFFAVAFSGLLGAPFLGVAFFSRSLLGLWINKVAASQRIRLVLDTLISCIIVLPLLILSFR